MYEINESDDEDLPSGNLDGLKDKNFEQSKETTEIGHQEKQANEIVNELNEIVNLVNTNENRARDENNLASNLLGNQATENNNNNVDNNFGGDLLNNLQAGDSGDDEDPNRNRIILELQVNNTDTMAAMSLNEYMSFCCRHLKDNFNGNPSELSVFLGTIKLLERFAVNDELKDVLNLEMFTKLTGKAATAVGEIPATNQETVERLKERIKFDSSKIVKAQIKSMSVNM